MSNLTIYPLEDNYESKLSQPYDGTSSIIYVDSIPTATLPSGFKVLVTINPWTSFAQAVEIDWWSAGQLNVSSTTVEKANGVNYTTRSHWAKSPIIISDNFSYWKPIATAINSKSDIASPVFTGSVWLPTYANSTARNAAILTPTQKDLVKTNNVVQHYNSSTAQREDFAIGTPSPNASTTAKGVVELSTLAERQAGTAIGSTGASLVPTNDALTTTSAWAGSAGLIPLLNTSGKLDNSFLSVSSDAIVRTFTAWEGMSTGQIFRQGRTISLPWTSISQLTANNPLQIWYDNTNQRVGQSYTSAWWVLTSIWVYLFKTGTPAWDLTCVVKTSAAGAGTVVATATNTVAETSITATTLWTATLFTFTFSSIELAAGTYYIDISTARANSTSNYSQIAIQWPSAYAWGTAYSISNTWVWSVLTGDRKFTLTEWAVTEVNTKVYKANSQSTTLNKVLWAVQATVVTDATFNWVIWWVVAWYTGQTTWEVYYLKDDWTTWTTAWTVSTKVWRALSATEINFVPPL